MAGLQAEVSRHEGSHGGLVAKPSIQYQPKHTLARLRADFAEVGGLGDALFRARGCDDPLLNNKYSGTRGHQRALTRKDRQASSRLGLHRNRTANGHLPKRPTHPHPYRGQSAQKRLKPASVITRQSLNCDPKPKKRSIIDSGPKRRRSPV